MNQPAEFIANILEIIRGRRVIASVSGGKDSAAMSLYLTELGIEHERVFCDTGWEHPVTYEYLRSELTAKIGPIAEIRGDLLMPDLVRKKGMFPSRTRRFCTEQLKVFPLQKYVRNRQDEIGDVVNAVGIRAAESRARSKLPEWEWNEGFDCEVWRPLLRWTEQQVIDIHARHGLRPNPLYLQGARRVGCWPCIFAAKAEIRHLADVDPDRIVQIRALEAEVQASAEARYTAKGETFDSRGYNRPTFFQAMGALRTEEGKDGRCVPIDDVVAWSRTSHGGKQIEMFAGTGEDHGCMRWGLCDTAPEGDPNRLLDAPGALANILMPLPDGRVLEGKDAIAEILRNDDERKRHATAARVERGRDPDAAAPRLFVCGECGWEQDSDVRPCGSCRSVRIVPISFVEEHFGADWRRTCFGKV